jgi:two-component system LytT family response regulator
MIRALIVDDVDLAREAIRVRLQEHDDLEIVGEASSGLQAASAIRTLNPDLVFLDVRMPGLDGFQVLESAAPSRLPSVIFVTAHDKYAVKAFQAHALHFLLKPIDDDQFSDALQRARQELSSRQTHENVVRRLEEFLKFRAHDLAADPGPQTSKFVSRFTVKDQEGFLLVKTEDVDWVQAAGNYAELHVGKRTFLIRMILGELEEKLDPAAFARISRSAIINIARIARLKPLWHGDFHVLLRDGTTLRMSRRYRRRLIS